MNNEEIILLETFVKINDKKLKLILTNQKMIFQKKIGIFNKRMKTIKEISLNEIKTYKNKIKIKQKNELLIIETLTKKIKINCDSILDAKRIEQTIIKIKNQESTKHPNFLTIDNIEKIAKITIAIIVAIKNYYDNKK